MHEWRLSDRSLTIGRRPLVMGVVNVTPDSFSDGGQFATTESAVEHALQLAAQGADILDLGGESSRPGAEPVSEEEELRRVLPVVQALAGRTRALLSIDTCKAAVARACLEAGAHIINDITGLASDAAMPEPVCAAGAGVILMHMQGTPATMQQAPQYGDVVQDIVHHFEQRLRALETAGIERARVVIDPGIGFGKTVAHNLEILARLEEFQRLGRPVCLGVSRKGLISTILGGRAVSQRLAGSLAILLHAVWREAVQIIRVHDVLETRDALAMFDAIEQARQSGKPR